MSDQSWWFKILTVGRKKAKASIAHFKTNGASVDGGIQLTGYDSIYQRLEYLGY